MTTGNPRDSVRAWTEQAFNHLQGGCTETDRLASRGQVHDHSRGVGSPDCLGDCGPKLGHRILSQAKKGRALDAKPKAPAPTEGQAPEIGVDPATL